MHGGRYRYFRTAVIVTLEEGKEYIHDYVVNEEDDNTVTVVIYRPEKPFDKFEKVVVTKERSTEFPALIEIY